MARVGRALRRLSRDHLQILYRVFGPRDPNARYDLLGPLAPLAEYTPTVEETRRKMVADAVELRVREIEEREGHRRATSATVIAHARIRAEQAHDEIIRLRELRGERGLSDDERAELLQWRREERAAARRNEEAERGVEVDAAALRDRLITGIGREITTSMALSVLLTRAHREAARVALEAAALLRDASAAYRTPSGHTHDAR
jgi:hypothetical protein